MASSNKTTKCDHDISKLTNHTTDKANDTHIRNDDLPSVNGGYLLDANRNYQKGMNEEQESAPRENEIDTTKRKTVDKPKPIINTLADLIHVCRDRGLQIYNDKKNIPDSDTHTLQVLPAYLTNPKIHRSDGLGARWRGTPVSSRRSRRRSSYRNSESPDYHDRTRSSHSGWTAQSYKSGSDSRLKSSTSSIPSRVHSEYSINTTLSRHKQQDGVSLDFPDVEGDIEAEKVLRTRMRRRSKRHKETVTNLFDVIKMKQKQLDSMDNKSNKILDDSNHQQHENDAVIIVNKEGTQDNSTESVHNSKDDYNINNENIVINTTENIDEVHNENTGQGKEDVSSETVHTIKDIVDEEQGRRLNETDAQEDSDGVHGKINEATENAKKHEDQNKTLNEVPKVGSEIDTEIQEYVIQEGNTKLVLYKLKTSTALLETLNNTHTSKTDKQSLRDEHKKDYITSGCHSQSNHIDFNLEQEALNIPISEVTENCSQGNSGLNGEINNSSLLNGNINHNTLTEMEQSSPSTKTLTELDCSKSLCETSNMVDNNGHSNMELCTKTTIALHENRLQKCDNKTSINTEVNKTSIDQVQLKDNKSNLKSDNDTSVDNVLNDTGNPKLDTVGKQVSHSPCHVSQSTVNILDSNRIVDSKKNHENCVVPSPGSNISETAKTKTMRESENKELQKLNVKSSIPKRPKRSLGNGFLVSSDVEDDDDDQKNEGDKGNIAKTGVNDRHENGLYREENSGSGVSPKAKTEDEVVPDETDPEDKHSKRKYDKRNSISKSNSSSRQSKSSWKSFSSVARQVLIATKIRQTYDEEKSTQASYVQEIGDTRKALWELYRKLKNREDLFVDKSTSTKAMDKDKKPKEATEAEETREAPDSTELPQENEKEQPNHVKDISQEVEQKHQDEPELEEETLDGEEQVTENGVDHVEPETPVSSTTDLESNGDVSSSSTRKSKPLVEKKIDNEWNPNHPLYDMLKTGFKSNYQKHDTRQISLALKGLRGDKFDTKQVSPNNEYVKEAKRIYPQGFPGTTNKLKKVNDKSRQKPIADKEQIKQSDPIMRYSPDKLTRETTLYGGKDKLTRETERDIQKTKDKRDANNADPKPKTVKRVVKCSNKTQQPTQETSTPSKKVIPRFKPKKRSNVVDIEDERLRQDRNNIEQYQHYMNNKEELPIMGNNHTKHNAKVTPRNHHNHRKGPSKIQKAKFKFTSQNDKDGDEPDDEADYESSDDVELETMATRENLKDRFKRHASERSLGSEKRSDDVPISTAVQIVQSRQKFYNEDGAVQTRQREHRVYKLFREIQMIRKGADDTNDSSTILEYPRNPNSSPFLMMDYDFSTISSHKTDTDFQNFLYGSMDYNMTFRSRSLHSYHGRREKALNDLREKLDQRHVLYSSNPR